MQKKKTVLVIIYPPLRTTYHKSTADKNIINMENTLYEKLIDIQQTLQAPKGQFNSFGNYNYRSCEDILNAVKPLLAKHKLALMLEDEMINLGDRYYVKATAILSDGSKDITNTAYAREALDKKGMDDSQITGATSSYARKYALNGLFAIDDTKDADTMDNTKVASKPATKTEEKDPTDDWERPQTDAPYCDEHKQSYYKYEKNGKVWYSHKNADGTWCNMK